MTTANLNESALIATGSALSDFEKLQPEHEIERDLAPLAKRIEWRWRILAAICGALTGLAAPGLELWFLPWVSLTTLILLTANAGDTWLASVRGYYFGIFYNFVYMSWLLLFRQEYSTGVYALPVILVSATFWILLAGMQGIYISVATCLIKALPVTGGWLPRRYQRRWHLPSFVVWPLLWILVDRLCNTTQLLGIPLTTLHYTQYKQLPLLQCASLIGGVGITAWIVLVNANLAAWFTHGRHQFASVNCASRRALLLNSAFTLLLSVGLIAYGAHRLSQATTSASTSATTSASASASTSATTSTTTSATTSVPADAIKGQKTVAVAALQANLSEVLHKAKSEVVVVKYLNLARACAPGTLCIWPEWSFPVPFSKSPRMFEALAVFPKRDKQSWVVGASDRGAHGELYNSACAIESSGEVLPQVYHKRYLVPVGEYLPDWIKATPLRFMMFGNNKLPKESSSGSEPVILPLKQAKIAPLICFEAAYPRLCAQSVRAGGELLVDCSDNSWFKSSILSDQMVSYCVLRAVENHRSFVFATALGPSTIIDSTGHILAQAPRQKESTVKAVVPLESDLTPYTRWCF